MKQSQTTLKEKLEQWSTGIFIFGIIIVLCATLFPFEFNFNQGFNLKTLALSFRHDVKLRDLIANCFLFVPFGLGLSGLLHRRKLKVKTVAIWVLSASLGLSFSVEILQAFLIARNPASSDILANSLSGLLGFSLFHLGIWNALSNLPSLEKSLRGILSLPWLMVGWVGYFSVLCLLLLSLQPLTTLDNWDPSFPLLLGNELTGTRPWQGRISQLCIADRAASETEISKLLNDGGSCSAIADALVASYSFMESGSYPDRTGNLPDLIWKENSPEQPENGGASLGSQHWLQTPESAAAMTQKIRETSQFTLSTTIASADTNQTGPARIISLSKDPEHRNLTLGQSGYNLSIRLRTPFTGENGIKPEAIVPDVFVNTNPHHLVIAYDGSLLRIYTDDIQNRHSIELTPAMVLFGSILSPFLGRIALNTSHASFYSLLCYGLLLIPLGAVLGLIAAILKGRFTFYVLLIGGGPILPAVFLEGILMLGSGRAMSLERLLMGTASATIAMRLVKRRAKSWQRSRTTSSEVQGEP